MSQEEKTEDNDPKPTDARGQQDKQSKDSPLDPSQLDLTIEEVEERISPSETNVFDK